MGETQLKAFILLLAGADPVGDVINAQNVPGIIVLSASGLVGMFFVVRWMVKFQKEFTNFYVEENKKLRERVDELEEEIKTKDKEVNEQARHINKMQIMLDEHEATIARLNRIVERRKLEE